MSTLDDIKRLQDEIADINRRLGGTRKLGSFLETGSRVYLSASQINPGAGDQLVHFDTPDWDFGLPDNPDFDTTNYKFDTRYTGYYLIICSLYLGGIVDGLRYYSKIFVNGAQVKQAAIIPGAAAINTSVICTSIEYVQAGEKIEGYKGGGDAATDILGGSSLSTFMAIALLARV